MTDQKTNVAIAAETVLSSSLASGATTINVVSTAAFPAVPFYVVIDPDVDAKREVVLVDSVKTATTFGLSDFSMRGLDNTSDTSHLLGAVVACVPVPALWRDINDRADAIEAVAAAAAVSATAAADDIAVLDGRVDATEAWQATAGGAATVGGLPDRVAVMEGWYFDVTTYGAAGDGVTDDTTAIQAAIDAAEAAGGGTVLLPPGTYLTSATIDLGQAAAVTLEGFDHHREETVIVSEALAGAVVRVWTRSCRIRHLTLDATAARQAAVTTTGHGMHVEGVDGATSNCSRTIVENVNVQRQPTDGLHVAGGFELARVELVTVADCLRHGFVFDDGTRAGRTNKTLAPFEWSVIDSRAVECAGNALLIGHTGETNRTRLALLDKFEALGCCWSASARESVWQVDLYTDQLRMVHPDVEDQQYAQTVTSSTGMARTGNATPASGIRLGGSIHTIEQPFFSSLIASITLLASACHATHVDRPKVFAGTYGINQTTAINFENGTTDCSAVLDTGQMQATTPLRNRCVGANLIIDSRRVYGLNSSIVDFDDNHVPREYTIASGTLNAPARRVSVLGEGGAADNFDTLQLAPGVPGVDGLIIELINRQTYAITIGVTVNIVTRTGANVVLGQYDTVRFVYDATGAKWQQLA